MLKNHRVDDKYHIDWWFLKLPTKPHERFRAGWAAAAAHGTEKSAAGHCGHSRRWGDPMIPELEPEMVGKWLENGVI